MPLKHIRKFFELEAAAGITLGLSALLAIIIANSSFATNYNQFIEKEVIIQFADWFHKASIKDWVKDGLMTIFFFHVGLEIKKEIVEGELSDPKKLALPVFGAIGGMVMPAIIFAIVAIAFGRNDILQGWPIPVATDIAFAVAAISIVSNKVPLSLKIFLLTLAVVDDLGAVILIAALYSHQIDYSALSIALALFITLMALPKIGIRRPWVFVSFGVIMWAFMLQSGFHATLAGVLTAICVPLKANNESEQSPLEDLHDDFDGWVKYLILPAFALTHAGFSFNGVSLETFKAPLVLGIMLGLMIGKPVGVLLMVKIASLLKIAKIPENITMQQLIGVGLLCGIGFTMSLFLGGLAFAGAQEIILSEVKIGVFTGSLLSGIIGVIILNKANQS